MILLAYSVLIKNGERARTEKKKYHGRSRIGKTTVKTGLCPSDQQKGEVRNYGMSLDIYKAHTALVAELVFKDMSLWFLVTMLS